MPESRPVLLLEVEQSVIAAYKCVSEAIKNDLQAGKKHGKFRIGPELRKYLLDGDAFILLRIRNYFLLRGIRYDRTKKILFWRKA